MVPLLRDLAVLIAANLTSAALAWNDQERFRTTEVPMPIVFYHRYANHDHPKYVLCYGNHHFWGCRWRNGGDSIRGRPQLGARFRRLRPAQGLCYQIYRRHGYYAPEFHQVRPLMACPQPDETAWLCAFRSADARAADSCVALPAGDPGSARGQPKNLVGRPGRLQKLPSLRPRGNALSGDALRRGRRPAEGRDAERRLKVRSHAERGARLRAACFPTSAIPARTPCRRPRRPPPASSAAGSTRSRPSSVPRAAAAPRPGGRGLRGAA